MTHSQPVTGLTIEGCLARQHRVREQLALHNIEGAVFADPGHVNYLTGYWTRTLLRRVVLMERDGPTTLLVGGPVEDELAADKVIVFESNKLCTLVDDQVAAALEPLESHLAGVTRLGCDGGVRAGLLGDKAIVDLEPAMHLVRRRKEADEVALLGRATAAAEAAYTWARAALHEGVDEVELYAGMLAAATEHAGEMLGEFGNDFQIASDGGPPRRRRAGAGEIAVFDLGVVLRGYNSDMCRSFVVGGAPSGAQREGHERVMQVLEHIEANARTGTRCRDLFEHARRTLDGFRGWSFPHHLGHGIGLSPHESPRLNPHYDDTLTVGDVFTAEPGLYHDELRAGLRIEHIYHVTDTGLERLTRFATDL